MRLEGRKNRPFPWYLHTIAIAGHGIKGTAAG